MNSHCRISSVTDKRTGRKLTIHTNRTKSHPQIDTLLRGLQSASRDIGIDSIVVNINCDGEYHSYYFGAWNDLITQARALDDDLFAAWSET